MSKFSRFAVHFLTHHLKCESGCGERGEYGGGEGPGRVGQELWDPAVLDGIVVAVAKQELNEKESSHETITFVCIYEQLRRKQKKYSFN